ncbi:MAG: NAD-dependent succinate-semialdehyde dehydrogenase, partial [Gammaproteobacteria bacterium]|nr:NAD-dependent succinate-semialdehyde dehydrogenase [Gammaproteobacteria bacterium]
AVCDYYAEHGPTFLADENAPSDADRSYIAHQPIGTVLAVMPWNFPFWQVFRFAAPALIAGNSALLKHASNVPQCAMAIEQIFTDAGFPDNTFRTLMIRAAQVADVIANPAVQAVTLTGSESAGRQVAACAGQNLKKSLLELGGSDAFIVLADADLDLTVRNAVSSRFLNAGQSCIAAKRFIVDERIADTFVERFKHAVQALKMGDPQHAETTLAPMARRDLRDELHQQVVASVEHGAQIVTGGSRPDGDGAYYPATILDRVAPGMPAYEEELFGPVASIIRVADATQAIEVANASPFGLGGSVWGRDRQQTEALALQVEAGACFVNGMVKSDPRLPFGGIKNSGYGRELYRHGMLEFVNAKTVWIKDLT